MIIEGASRFARDLMTQELGILSLIKLGVRVMTATGDDLTDTSDPTGWTLFDRLAGLVRLDERRAEGPVLRDLQTHLMERIDRKKAAIAHNPLMMERHNYHGYLDDLASAQERAWQDYRWRLANDASATFEAAPEESAR